MDLPEIIGFQVHGWEEKARVKALMTKELPQRFG